MPTAARKAALQPAATPPDPAAASTPPAPEKPAEPASVFQSFGVYVHASTRLCTYTGASGWQVNDAGFLTVLGADDEAVAEFAPGYWGAVEYIVAED